MQRIHGLFGFGIALLALLGGCREPFTPKIDEFQEVLVVEGRITDDPTGSQVTLSRSYGFGQDEVKPVTGAGVIISEAGGTSHQLTETAPGVYRTNPAVFVGQAGKTYQLALSLPDGKRYLSEPQTLLLSPPIDSLSFEYQIRPTSDPDLDVEGVQIFVDTRGTDEGPRNFQWEYDETWEFFVPFPIFERWEWTNPPRTVPIGADEQTRHCWQSDIGTGIHVGTSRGLSQNTISKFPMAFVGSREGKFAWTYSIRVKQYALSDEEYSFLKVMQQNTETTGSLFDPIPAEVRGNIREEGNPETPVIGFFGASTLQEKRLFIDRQELPENAGLFRRFAACKLDTLPLEWQPLLDAGVPTNRYFYDTLYNIMYVPIGLLIVDPNCGDCRLNGTSEKPVFWP
jgi:hypothetical protein